MGEKLVEGVSWWKILLVPLYNSLDPYLFLFEYGFEILGFLSPGIDSIRRSYFFSSYSVAIIEL